jgi:hypothetical protein
MLPGQLALVADPAPDPRDNGQSPLPSSVAPNVALDAAAARAAEPPPSAAAGGGKK